MTRVEKILLYTLAAVNFTNIMDFMIMMPLGPQLMRILHMTPQQFGLVVASYSISAFLSGVITTLIINRFDRKKFLQWIYAGFLIGTFACGLVNSYELLLAARFFTGLFGGVMGAIILSIVSDETPLERRGQAMGIIMSAFAAASVLGVPFGTFIAVNSEFGWHAPFLFLGILSLPVQYLLYKYIPSRGKKISQHYLADTLNNLKFIFTDRNHLMAMALGFIIIVGHFSIIPMFNPYLVSNVGLDEKLIPYIYLLGGGATIFSSPLIGKLADRVGKMKVFAIFIFLYLIPVFLITNMAPSTPLYIFSISTIFFVFSSGRFIPSQAMVTGAVRADVRATFMSINSSIQQLGTGLASWVMGYIIVKDDTGHFTGYDVAGYFSLGMALLSLWIAWRVRTADGKSF
jgi:predicted MFS family arabinose efflux permease